MKDESNKGETHQLKHDKQEIADDEGPLPTVAVAGEAKDDGPDGPEHEHHRDAPCDVRLSAPKRLGEIADRQRDGEEVERVPCLSPPLTHTSVCVVLSCLCNGEVEGWAAETHPGAKGDEEERPLRAVERAEEAPRVRSGQHWGLEAAEPGRQVPA